MKKTVSFATAQVKIESDIDTILANAAPTSKPATAPVNDGAEYDNGETP
ncbi:hypothetical protein M2138_001505 [Dysgonomonadaceae bacterium PH5-43]|nr:hypothetical protein [Dysgonomonadaceae bacterium PH5-43]